MKDLLKIIIPVIFLVASVDASAGRLMFGDQESIRRLETTGIKLPDGKELYLGHLVVMHSFLLPYFVESEGLVLGIAGDSKRYLPLPEGEKLAALQATGMLPEKLPTPKLGLPDYLVGFALEIAIVVLFAFPLLKRAFRKTEG